MIVHLDTDFDMIDVTLDVEEAGAILKWLYPGIGTYKQFNIMLQLRSELESAISQAQARNRRERG